jgi:hypothetical protein
MSTWTMPLVRADAVVISCPFYKQTTNRGYERDTT